MPERVARWSLRGRHLAIATIALVASLLVGGVAMYWATGIEEDQIMDSRLELLGATVLALLERQVETELLEVTSGNSAMPLNMKTRPSAALLYRFQVWTRHGSLLMRSHEAPEDRPLTALSRFGFDTVRINGEDYRTFALPSTNREFVIQVAENIDERWTQGATISLYFVGFLLIPLGLVFGGTLLWLLRSLRSIDSLAGQLAERNPMDMSPVKVSDPPRELLPILKSIDALTARVGHALSVERKFTSVAAHEMRTPLAGLRAHAQLAAKARTDDELKEALDSVMLGADRASHLIEQLLDLARVETMPKDIEPVADPVRLSDVYQAVMHELDRRATAKQITVAARFPVDEIRAHRFAVFVLLRNLLANAIAYTPVGGHVSISSQIQGNAVVLTVDDSGPGIRSEDRERAFERFNRLGQAHIEGVGLGLSIVHSVVDLHRATLRLLDSPLGGLRVEMAFPQALV